MEDIRLDKGFTYLIWLAGLLMEYHHSSNGSKLRDHDMYCTLFADMIYFAFKSEPDTSPAV
jgi:hypothetical protein